MLGILGINKPVGITSRDALNHVSRLLKPRKVGHAGTLDPIASGVLVVCIGSATRLIEMVHAWPKEYIATFQLGQSSPSDDTETECTPMANAPIPSRAEIEAVLPRFLGEISQVPPAFSAVKVNGQRAYHVARKGKTVELTARPVQIDELEIVDYQYPRLFCESFAEPVLMYARSERYRTRVANGSDHERFDSHSDWAHDVRKVHNSRGNHVFVD